MMKRSLMYLIAVMVVLAAVLGVYSSFNSDRPKELKATFADERGKKIDVIFFFAEQPMADVALGDGRSFLLAQGLSASGARYVNPDESFVLWIKGDRAFIEENGKRIFDGILPGSK